MMVNIRATHTKVKEEFLVHKHISNKLVYTIVTLEGLTVL
jgi:hypothetical protein